MEKITGVGKLIEDLKKDLLSYKYPIWYRGQSVNTWELLPSLARLNNRSKNENDLINRFKQNASLLLESRRPEGLEWLFLMQHYSIPTRLLDWSESPLTALYFAVTTHKNSDGAFFVLKPLELNKITIKKINYIISYDSKPLENYKPDTVASEQTSELNPIAILAPRNSMRMHSQLGAFTISHRLRTPLEEIGNRKHIKKYVVPKNSKKVIEQELKLLGITKFQLFPELNNIAEVIKR